MNYTISMTDILLAVSVGCNLWFLFLLLYERIMDTRIVRFFKGIAGLWRSLDGNEAKRIAAHEEVPAEKADIIGKSRFRMASTRTTAAIPTQEAATSEKGIELSEEEATFDDGKRETHPARHKSRRKNSMRPSRAYRRRNWDTGTTNRKRTPRTRHGLRAAALTRLTTPARPPRTRTRHRRNVKRRRRCSPTWRARSCTRNDGRLFGDRHPHQGAYRDSAEEI